MKHIILIILILTLIIGCYKESDYAKDSPTADAVILSILPNRPLLFANNTDTTIIRVEIPLQTTDAASVVSFKASTGTFVESTKADAQSTATISQLNGVKTKSALITYMASASPGTANIDVKVAGYQKTMTIILAAVLADSLTMIPAVISMHPDWNSEVNIIGKLTSSKGKVTPGQLVSISVKDTSGTDKGTFRLINNLSNDSGETNFVYAIAPDTSYRGKLVIRGSALVVGRTSPLLDTAIIYIAR